MDLQTITTEKRASLRFDVVFPVVLSSEEFGRIRCIARNVSAGGMFVEALEPLPIGLPVKVHFTMERAAGEIIARAEIKNHYYLAFRQGNELRSLIGMGLKFSEFEAGSDESFGRSLTRCKTIH